MNEPQKIPTMPLGPVPTIVSMGIADAGGQHFVQLNVSTPMGLVAIFIDAENAKKVGQDMIYHAQQAHSGIVVPLQRIE